MTPRELLPYTQLVACTLLRMGRPRIFLSDMKVFSRLGLIATTYKQVWPVGNDTAIAMGEFRLTGKNQSGAPIEAAGIWTSVDVREAGKWKIRMLSAIPNPPPAPAK